MTREHRFGRVALDLALLSVVLVAAGYWLSPVLDAGFLTDDYHVLEVVARDLDPASSFSSENLGHLASFYWRQAHPRFQLYRPTVLVSYGLTYLASGTSRGPYQATNLALHLLCVALVFALVRSVLPRAESMVPALAAAFFAFSPLQIESVAWSAARSETFGLAFGLGALIWRIRRTDARLVPALLFAAAMTCKESALVFGLALVIIEGADLLAAGKQSRRLQRGMRRLVMLFAVFVAYFALRYVIFGSLFSTSYNSRGFASYLEDPGALLERYGRSMLVVMMPLSQIVYEEDPLRYWLAALSLTGFLGLVLRGTSAGWRLDRRMLMVAVVLFGVPFGLGVLVNEIGTSLVNSRAVYTSMAGLALLLGFQMAAGTATLQRWGFAVCLITVGIVVSRPCQALWVDAHDAVERRLESLRAPLEANPNPNCTAVCILGYVERRYFHDEFNMASAIRVALRRPFMRKDYELLKVASDAIADRVPIDEVFKRDPRTVAIFSDGPPGDEDQRCTFHSPGRFAVEGVKLALQSPEAGATLTVHPARQGEFRPVFRFEAVAPAGAAIDIQLFTPAGLLGAMDATGSQVPGSPGRFVHVLAGLPPEIVAAIDEPRTFAWQVVITDAAGELLAASELRRLEIRPER